MTIRNRWTRKLTAAWAVLRSWNATLYVVIRNQPTYTTVLYASLDPIDAEDWMLDNTERGTARLLNVRLNGVTR